MRLPHTLTLYINNYYAVRLNYTLTECVQFENLGVYKIGI